MEPQQPHQTKRSVIIIGVALAALFITLASTAWRPAITNQLNKWKLLPEPEKLTELYFNHPNNLPSTYVPGQSQNVSFTVHNLEYQTMTYTYKIVEENQAGSQSQVLTSSRFTLHEGQYKSVSFAAPLVDEGQKAEIVVELPTTHESIDYLVTRSNS